MAAEATLVWAWKQASETSCTVLLSFQMFLRHSSEQILTANMASRPCVVAVEVP